jgi:hypothetical protein
MPRDPYRGLPLDVEARRACGRRTALASSPDDPSSSAPVIETEADEFVVEIPQQGNDPAR